MDDDHTVTGRVIAVLEAVAALGDRATLAGITRHTGVPKPTLRRIANDLAVRGMLDRRDGVYRLGPRLLRLGVVAGEQQGLREVSAYVQDLHARSGEVAWLMMRDGASNTMVQTVFGTNRMAALRGRAWPSAVRSPAFLASAAGRLVLAAEPDLFDELRARPFPRASARTVTDWRHIAMSLDTTRDTGLAVEHEQSSVGWSCVAAGVRGAGGTLVAMVGVCGRSGTLRTDRLSRPILVAAQGISGSLPTGP